MMSSNKEAIFWNLDFNAMTWKQEKYTFKLDFSLVISKTKRENKKVKMKCTSKLRIKSRVVNECGNFTML